MSHVIDERTLFRPARSSAEAKADATDRTARTIIAAETERRDANTARLREARLKRDAELAAASPAPAKSSATKPRVRKTAAAGSINPTRPRAR